MNTNNEFTFADAYRIQTEHLTDWSTVLTPLVYIQLLCEILERNRRPMKTPYDVCRGQEIDAIVHNIAMQNGRKLRLTDEA